MPNYKNYFRDHYKVNFSEKDILNYERWFNPQWKLIRNKILRQFLNNKDITVLEIGSGIGGFFNILKKVGIKNYLGLEIDKQASNFCKEYFNSENFLNKSIEKLDTKKKFDAIFSFEVLEHLEEPRKAIKKINLLLKDGGIFIGTTPFPFKKNIIADRTHIFVLHPFSWKKLFIENDFKRVDLYPMSFIPFIWRLNKNLNFRMPFYVPFNNFISTCLIIARK